jgi:hypothetical protein
VRIIAVATTSADRSAIRRRVTGKAESFPRPDPNKWKPDP